MRKTIDFYNVHLNQPEVTYDPASISWTWAALTNVKNKRQAYFSAAHIRPALYRPFCKANLYFDRMWNERVYQQPKLFPTEQHGNLVIQLTGNGSTKPFPVS